MTVAEFLEWDGGGHVGKLELVEGEVVAMSPASGTHAIIQGNLAGLIWKHLREKRLPCRLGTEAPVIPRFHANDNARAPDLAVTCLDTPPGKVFPDPVLIIEVLSPSNRSETWNSIMACATIPTLAEIAVVDSEKIHVEIYRKDVAGNWPPREERELVVGAGTVRLNSIGAELAISDIYAGTVLEPASTSDNR